LLLDSLREQLEELEDVLADDLRRSRREKYRLMGVYV
jgi:acetyl-CoA carboxylase alpha subunit